MTTCIVALSDTHGMHEQLSVPPGDILLHAGDLTAHGTLEELEAFNHWLGSLPHRHKLVIAGNHDWVCQEQPELISELLSNAIYLCDRLVTVDGLRCYGSPWQPRFYDWAFNLDPPALRRVWAQVPAPLDVLITHTPPRGLLDRTARREAAGCVALRAELARIRPRLHIFGHIHEAYGSQTVGATTFANASSCTLRYQPSNPPLVFELP